MEDQGERSPQTFLGNNFPSFNRDVNKTIGGLSSASFEYRSGINASVNSSGAHPPTGLTPVH